MLTKPNARQSLGQHGERLAEEFLRKQGFTIVERNWRTRWGEVDLIARRGNSLHFVEVKTRGVSSHGEPHEAVNRFKQSQVLGAAKLYVATKRPEQKNYQIDAVSVVLDKISGTAQIKYFENIALDN